jgi:site-specific recombinase XerD
VQFLFYTGARINEATGLRLADCTPAGKMVSLRIMGKGRKERILNIPSPFFQRLRDYYQGETYLFETRNKRRWNNSAFTVNLSARRSGRSGGRSTHTCYGILYAPTC